MDAIDNAPEIVQTLGNMHICFAALVGMKRRMSTMYRPEGAWGQTRDNGWQDDVLGAIGECVLARWLGVFWDGSRRDKDVAGVYQVRTTPWRNGHLILHPEDKDRDAVVLVLAHDEPRYVLRGWMTIADGKQECYWGELKRGRPAYNVPQTMLRPMHELPMLDAIRRDVDLKPRMANGGI